MLAQSQIWRRISTLREQSPRRPRRCKFPLYGNEPGPILTQLLRRRGMSFDVENAADAKRGVPGHIPADLEAIAGTRPRRHRCRRHGRIFARAARSLSRAARFAWCGQAPREEVAEVLKLCHETATPVVPQGGNTGLVGRPDSLGACGNAIVLSLGPHDGAARDRSWLEHDDRRSWHGPCLRAGRGRAARTGCFRCRLRRKAPAPSAAISRPMRAARM